MTLEEIQSFTDEMLLNKLLSTTSKFLGAFPDDSATPLYYLMKDLKRETLFRMHYGSKGQATTSIDEDGDFLTAPS